MIYAGDKHIFLSVKRSAIINTMPKKTIKLKGSQAIEPEPESTPEEKVADDPVASQQPEKKELQSNKPPKPPKADPVAQPSSDSLGSVSRIKNIRKIQQYRSLFPQEVECIRGLSSLEKKTDAEIDDLLHDVQQAVESRRSATATRSMFLAGLTVGESSGYMFGLQLQGLTNVAANSPELMKTVDECGIKYMDRFAATDPVLRLCIGLGHLVVAVDANNRAKKNNAPVMQNNTSLGKGKPDNIAPKEFNDL